MKQHVESGIGRALRRAREERGKSLEEASRETRVRIDYLRAIEQEWFSALGNDVYVRGFLRSYSRYLGLNADKVVGAYERAFGSGSPAPSPVEEAPTVAPTEALELTERRRPNWLLAGAVAIIVLAAAATIGIFGRTDTVPETSGLQPPPQQPIVERQVEVGIQALGDVTFRITVDGEEPTEQVLAQGEGVQFVGQDSIRVTSESGGRFTLIVNGHEMQRGGQKGVPFDMTFTPETFRGTGEDGSSGEDDRSTDESPSA